MLFHRKPKKEAPPPAPPATKSRQYCGETYQVTRYPDTGRIAVSGHGRTCYIQAQNKDAPGFQFTVSEIREYQENLFYPPMPITRRAEKTVSWEHSPEAALQEACRLLRLGHQQELKKLAAANAPSAAERLSKWFAELPDNPETYPDNQLSLR